MTHTPGKNRYLEITFRKGKPFAAYLYLPRLAGDASAHTRVVGHGLVIDYAADGRAIGIEITSPASISLADLNAALASIHEDAATTEEFRPLLAA